MGKDRFPDSCFAGNSQFVFGFHMVRQGRVQGGNICAARSAQRCVVSEQATRFAVCPAIGMDHHGILSKEFRQPAFSLRLKVPRFEMEAAFGSVLKSPIQKESSGFSLLCLCLASRPNGAAHALDQNGSIAGQSHDWLIMKPSGRRETSLPDPRRDRPDPHPWASGRVFAEQATRHSLFEPGESVILIIQVLCSIAYLQFDLPKQWQVPALICRNGSRLTRLKSFPPRLI